MLRVQFVTVAAVLTLGFQLVPLERAVAGPLAPTKASDTRLLISSPTHCSFSEDYLVDQQQNLEGAWTPFSVPPGTVFVVTGYDWRGFGGNHSQLLSAQLELLDSNNNFVRVISTSDSMSDANGNVHGSAEISPGVVIKGVPPNKLCLFSSYTSSAFAIVRGFVAKDK